MEGDVLVVEESAYRGDDLAHHAQRLGAVDTDFLRQRIPPGTNAEDHAAGGQIVEGGESGGQAGRVATPAIDDAATHLDRVGHAGEGGHRNRGFAHQAALGLPHRIETALFGVLGELHSLADAVCVLEVDGDGLDGGHG